MVTQWISRITRHFGRPTGDDLGCLFFFGGGGLGNPRTDHRSKISWITVHQRNRRILSQSGFISSFDILWSKWSSINDPFSGFPKKAHPKWKFILWNASQNEVEWKQAEFQTALTDTRLNYWKAKVRSLFHAKNKNHEPTVPRNDCPQLCGTWFSTFDQITCNKNTNASFSFKKWRMQECSNVHLPDSCKIFNTRSY